MEDEELLKNEARSFIDFKLDRYQNEYRGHKIIMKEILDDLESIFSDKDKFIYLNEVSESLTHKIDEHIKYCAFGADQSKCSVFGYYKSIEYYLKQEISRLPRGVISSKNTISDSRTTVFISYSRKDDKYLEDLKPHFGPLEHLIEFWDDTKIQPGQRWEDEIMSALKKSRVAVLFVSKYFLDSKFIRGKEIPPLLEAADKDGMTIINVFLSHCYTDKEKIMMYQGVNQPENPISTMSEADRDRIWVSLMKSIVEILEK